MQKRMLDAARNEATVHILRQKQLRRPIFIIAYMCADWSCSMFVYYLYVFFIHMICDYHYTSQ